MAVEFCGARAKGTVGETFRGGVDRAARSKVRSVQARRFAQSILKRLRASGRSSSAEWWGKFHKGSKKYLPLYVAWFQFRYNNRMNPDIFGPAIKEC
jgi:hypothetical protein